MKIIRFIFTAEQEKSWQNDDHNTNPNLAKRIRNSMQNSENGKHAVIRITDKEFDTFVKKGKPIRIATLNILTVPNSPVTL